MTPNGQKAPQQAPHGAPMASPLAFWRAGFGLAAVVVGALVGLGAWLWVHETRQVEDHNRAAEALGKLRCVARLIDRYQAANGSCPLGTFEEVLAAVAPQSPAEGDLLYQSLTSDDVAFSHYFTHERAQGGRSTVAEIGRFRHEEVGLVDPFGKPYQYIGTVTSGYTTGLVLSRRPGFVINTPGQALCRYVVVSNGVDRKYGTEDDIRVTSETPADIKAIVPMLRRPFED